jgi:hypothetical protein
MDSRMRFALIAIAFFTILVGVSGAQGVATNFYCSTSLAAGGISPDIFSCINSAIPYVIIALLFSFSLVAFAYLIGEVLNIQSFKGWYRAELWEAIKSLLIVGIIFSVIVIFGEVASFLPNAPQNAGTTASIDFLYVNAYNYLVGCNTCNPQTLGAINYTNESYNNLLGISIGSQFLQNSRLMTYFTVPVPPVPVPAPPVEVVFDFGGNYNAYQSSIITTAAGGGGILSDTMTYLIFPMLLALIVQANIFVFLIQLGIGILLPLGLIFRATPFLRSIGGTLIALAITAIIIYPALLALFNAPISLFFSPLYPAPGATGIGGLNCQSSLSVCSLLTDYNPVVTALFAQLPSGLEDDSGAFQAGNTGASLAFLSGDIFFVLDPFFTYILPVIVAFILFILDILIGVVLATNIAKLLGGNIRLGIGKLKLA